MLVVVGLTAWRPMPAGVWHDDGVYVLVGKAISDGGGLTYQGVVGAPPAVKFPPVYPAFIAGLWRTFGDLGPVTLGATLANLVFLALAGALLARALHAGAGLPLPAALLGGGLGAVSGDVLRTTSAVLSEPLFLAMMGTGLSLWPGAVRDRSRRARWALAGVLLLLIATRSAGLAFVVGIGIALAIRAGPAAAAAIAGAALAFWVGWSGWAAARGAMVPADMADLLGPYAGWIREQVANDPVAFAARLPAHVAGVVERIGALLVPRATGAFLWVAALPVLGVAGLGWWRSVRSFPPLAWSSLAYLGMLLAWPYLDRRLVVPLHLLVVGLIAIGVTELVTRTGWLGSRGGAVPRPGRAGQWAGPDPASGGGPAPSLPARAAVVLVGAWVAFYGVVNTHRIASGWPASAYEIRAERLAGAVEAMGRTVPADAVVGAPEFWAALHLHGGWTVAPSVLFDPASTDAEAPSWGSPEAQERLWRSAGIEYLLLEQGGLLHGAALDRLEARCPDEIRVLARVPPMLIVRLPWASAARGPRRIEEVCAGSGGPDA